MNSADDSVSTLRQWCQKLDEAYLRYKMARAQYKELLERTPEGQLRGGKDLVALARREESETLAEYTRLLKIFSELMAERRIPKVQSASAEGETRVAETLISVVDDDESIRDSTKILLRSVGYKVATFESGELFLNSDVRSETECLILDLRMSGMDGLELQRRLRISDGGVPIIFVTAHDTKRNRQLAFDGGASDFFQKPFVASEFLAAIRTALERRS